MNNLMLTVISLSVSGGILIAILLLLKPLLKTRLSHKWQYYIWMVVVARLLIPFSFDVNLIERLTSRMFTNEVTINQSEIYFPYMGSPIENNNLTTITDVNNGGELNTHTYNEVFVISDIPNESNANPVAFSNSYSIFSQILPNLWILWLAVGAILLVRKITIYQGFVRYVMSGASRVDDINAIEKLGNIMEKHKIKSHVELYTNGLISSPLIIGFLRPKIILPTLNINENDLNNTLLHELTHYKRGDMFYKWLVQFVNCLHWFNPLVYLMSREINKSCEFSCDEAVVSNLNESEIRSYGDTLINALKYGAGYDNSVTSMNLGSSSKQIKERLDMIMKCKKASKFGRVLTFMVTMFFIMGAAVIGVYAENDNAYQGNDEIYNYEDYDEIETVEEYEEPEIETALERNFGNVIIKDDLILNFGDFIIENDIVLNVPFLPAGEMVRIGELVINEGYYAFVSILSPRNAHLGFGTRPVPWEVQGGTNWRTYRGSVNVIMQSGRIEANLDGYLYVGAHQYIGERYSYDDLWDVTVRIEFHPVGEESTNVVANTNTETVAPTPTPVPQSNLQDPFDILNNIHQVLPFLSQEVINELFLYAFETGHSSLRRILPFVSPALLEQAIRDILESTGELGNPVAAMVPFVSTRFLNELMIDYIVVRGNSVDMRRILPFMSPSVIEQIVIEMINRGDSNVNLNHFAPFVSTEFLDEMVLSVINR